MSMTGDYPNRSDLRTGQAEFTDQTYGERERQRRAQQMVPTGPPPEPGLRAEQPVPGVAPLLRETERPDEPITAGSDFGPGNDAFTAGIKPKVVEFDDTLLMLRSLYAAYPNPGLARFLSKYEERLT